MWQQADGRKKNTNTHRHMHTHTFYDFKCDVTEKWMWSGLISSWANIIFPPVEGPPQEQSGGMQQTHTDPLSRLELALAGSQLPSCLYQWAEDIHYPEQGAWCFFPLAVKVILVSCIRAEREMETSESLPNSHSKAYKIWCQSTWA